MQLLGIVTGKGDGGVDDEAFGSAELAMGTVGESVVATVDVAGVATVDVAGVPAVDEAMVDVAMVVMRVRGLVVGCETVSWVVVVAE